MLFNLHLDLLRLTAANLVHTASVPGFILHQKQE